jgi:predicted adenylyl cyclase CyaB
VKKIRYLYLAGQTRIHLDDVEGLGYFMELEVVMRPGQSDAEGQSIAEELMTKLGIAPGDLLDGAYMDMIEKNFGK